MNCLKKTFLAAAVLTFFGASTLGADFDEIAKKLSKTQTIQASWTMQTISPALERPVISSGIFYFKKGLGFRWEQIKPDISGLLFINNEVLSYRTIDDDIEIEDISDKKAAKNISTLIYAFISMDMKTLKKIYRIQGDEKGLVFYPKNAKRSPFEKIEFYLAENFANVERIILLSGSSSKTEIIFSSVRIDEDIDEDIFSL